MGDVKSTKLPRANKWLPVKKEIESKIISGEYTAGQKLPSIFQVAKLYGIGGSTAQKVLESLADDGVVVRKSGVGYFVKPFIKDRLAQNHELEFRALLEEIIKSGLASGFSKEQIQKYLVEYLDNY